MEIVNARNIYPEGEWYFIERIENETKGGILLPTEFRFPLQLAKIIESSKKKDYGLKILFIRGKEIDFEYEDNRITAVHKNHIVAKLEVL